MSEKEKEKTCHFGDLLQTPCHKPDFCRSTGLKNFEDFTEAIQCTYLWRAGLLGRQQEIKTICLHHEQLFGNVFERRASKCCGVLKNHHRKLVGLRRISLDMAELLKSKSYDVIPGQMLCRHCIDEYENLSVTNEQSDIEDPIADIDPTDDIDEAPNDANYNILETPRKKLNTSLETIGVSPVHLHGVPQHSRAKSAKQKLDKVVNTYKNNISEAYNVNQDVLDDDSVFRTDLQWKAAELDRLHDAMREKLKTASYPDKIQILTLVPDTWSREYAAKQFKVSEYLIRTARELKKNGGILSKPAPKRGKKISQETIDLVTSFYEDDEYSRQMPGKNDYVSVGKGVHKQKRLVLCNLTELHAAFKEKHSNVKIGFSRFCTLRPKWCILAGSSGTHSVCVCSIHQNAVLLVDAIDWDYTYKDLIKKVVCDPENKECMMHRCVSCPGTSALQKFVDDELGHLDMDSDMHYCQWDTTDRASLTTFTATYEEYKDLLVESIDKLTRHSYLSKAQSNYVKSTKESLGRNEVLVLGDFAENYQFLIQDEIQSYHWSKEYCTLHPLVIYYKDSDGNLQHHSLCFISDDNIHDTSFVYQIQKLLVNFLKENLPHVTKIIYVSDGCGGQYKNFKNFINLCFHKQDFDMDAEWIFFATSHGKSPCDGIGGSVKRHAAKRSLQRPLNNQILDYKAMLAVCEAEMKSIVFFDIGKEEMQKVREEMEKRYEEGKTVPGTRSSHHFIPQTSSKIAHKLCSEDESFVDVHDFNIPTHVDISSIAPSSYVTCAYNSFWWVGLIKSIDKEMGDVHVDFMHPHGPRKTFNWPSRVDSCDVPFKNIVYGIDAPTTITGRTYKINNEDYNKTVAAFAKLHS